MNKEPEFKIGDTVWFLRQGVGYETKMLKGKIVDFNYTENMVKERTPVAHIKAKCEYGSALQYNHTIAVCSLKKEYNG